MRFLEALEELLLLKDLRSHLCLEGTFVLFEGFRILPVVESADELADHLEELAFWKNRRLPIAYSLSDIDDLRTHSAAASTHNFRTE